MNNQAFYLSDAIETIQEILDGGGSFRMMPKGSSMLPLIVQGRDTVVLKKRTDSPHEPVKKYEIAFYRRKDGQFVLHRVMKTERDGTYTMCGDHQLTLEKKVLPEQILGYVSQLYKGNKLVSMTSLRYKIYLFFWTWMPFRHCVMFPGRVLRYWKRKKNESD